MIPYFCWAVYILNNIRYYQVDTSYFSSVFSIWVSSILFRYIDRLLYSFKDYIGHHLFIQLSYSAESTVLSDKSRFPRFFRNVPPGTTHNPARVQLMKMFGWRKAYILHREQEFYETVCLFHWWFNRLICHVTIQGILY